MNVKSKKAVNQTELMFNAYTEKKKKKKLDELPDQRNKGNRN